MEVYFVELILAAALGLVSIVIPMLLVRREISQAYTMLALFLLFTAVAHGLPILTHLFPSLAQYSLAIVIPSYICQPVCIWFYVKGICSPTPWYLHQNSRLHFILPLLSLLYAITITVTSPEHLSMIFYEGEQPLSSAAENIALITFIFMVAWTIQSSIYIVFIITRLIQYRRELKQLFASNDQREMGWLFFIILGLPAVWILSFSSLMMSFSGAANNALTNTLLICHFLLLWLLSFWGLRQKPGFSDRYLKKEEVGEIITSVTNASSAKKYMRSGIDESVSTKIAEKVDSAMQGKCLYLNPDLSLKTLALEIGEKPNYVSQALNQVLQKSFFDYVNDYRIEYSKTLLAQNNLSVLDIALDSGFNAKSSFYKAFKKNTGTTPKQFTAKEKYA